MKNIIGILGIPTCDENYSVIALFNDYKNIIVEHDYIPFMICPLLNIDYYNTKSNEIPELTEKEKNAYKKMVDMCDGIIIPGGNRMYNFQAFVTEYAIEKNIPVLGICMGMQLMANIDNKENCIVANETEINHRQSNTNYVHKVKIKKNTLLNSIIKKNKINVNSCHNYHVSKVNKFIISSYSEDGIIESIELPEKKFVLGVQWHPEKMTSYDLEANKIIDSFIDACNKRS